MRHETLQQRTQLFQATVLIGFNFQKTTQPLIQISKMRITSEYSLALQAPGPRWKFQAANITSYSPKYRIFIWPRIQAPNNAKVAHWS